MDPIYWLLLFIVLLVVEIITLGLTTIWFAGGALVSFILAMLHVGSMLQWGVFCAVSLILLFATRPWAVRYFNSQKKEKTNVDSLAGKTAVVTSEIRNLEGKGEVHLMSGQAHFLRFLLCYRRFLCRFRRVFGWQSHQAMTHLC